MKYIKTLFYTCLITCTLLPLYYIFFHLVDNTPIVINDIWMNIIFTFLATGLNASSVIMLIRQYIDKKFPWHLNKTKRVVFEIITTNSISIVGSSIVFTIFVFIFPNNEITNGLNFILNEWYNVAVISIIINSLAVSIHEARHLLREWMKIKIEAEQLQREKAESQYAALKNQVNPHFLFNSLNSLSSLIRVSPDKAIEFVDKFSKIYRYVLDVNDKLVVSINDELNFLKSYYFLQTIRFGNNLQINTQIDACHLSKCLIPLSIQILIENAIKHNEISSQNPLIIDIYIENNHLIINNNLQPKCTLEHSNGLGLRNIKERYKHFSDIEPRFFIENNRYYAYLPLLEE